MIENIKHCFFYVRPFYDFLNISSLNSLKRIYFIKWQYHKKCFAFNRSDLELLLNFKINYKNRLSTVQNNDWRFCFLKVNHLKLLHNRESCIIGFDLKGQFLRFFFFFKFIYFHRIVFHRLIMVPNWNLFKWK